MEAWSRRFSSMTWKRLREVRRIARWLEVEAEAPELVVVSLAQERTHLIIEAWHADRGLTRHER